MVQPFLRACSGQISTAFLQIPPRGAGFYESPCLLIDQIQLFLPDELKIFEGALFLKARIRSSISTGSTIRSSVRFCTGRLNKLPRTQWPTS